MEFEFDSQFAKILTYANLARVLSKVKKSRMKDYGIWVVFEIHPVELEGGKPGYLWGARIRVGSKLLRKLLPGFPLSKDVPKFTTVAGRVSTTSTELIMALRDIVPRVVWHWVGYIIKSKEEPPASRLGNEIRRLIPEIAGRSVRAGWVQL